MSEEGILLYALTTPITQFDNSSRVEIDGECEYIYDPTETRRWRTHDFMSRDGKRRLELGLHANVGSTWSILMQASQDRSPKTGNIINTNICLNVVEDSASEQRPMGRCVGYNIMSEGRLSHGYGSGFNAPLVEVERDLKNAGALAIKQDDLPKRIDVDATVVALTQNFLEGRFDPPPFVLTKDPKICSVDWPKFRKRYLKIK